MKILYTIIVKFSSGNFCKYHNVNNIERFAAMIQRKKDKAVYCNVYQKESRKFIQRIIFS